jgi:mono/diheme cytochrome c family protein
MNPRWIRMGLPPLLAASLLQFFVAPVNADESAEATFKGKCAMCHGPDGAGKTMMGEKLKIPDLQSADVQKKTDADLKAIIIKGKNKMPGYETKLSKEQIDKLVAHLRDLAKKH